MITIPPGFNGAISPKLKVCVSSDCSSVKFYDTTGLTNSGTPFGWVPENTTPPFIRNIIAFSEIKVVLKSLQGEELISTIVYNPSLGVNMFPSTFTEEMVLFSTTWGQPDGIYIIEYIFKYQDDSTIYGDPTNALNLASKYVVCTFNKIVTCKSKQLVTKLWLKYIKGCCSDLEQALEAQALLYAVEAAAACGDEFNADSILKSLHKILSLEKNCSPCKSNSCKC
jgi:hypothetical protein